MVNDLLKYKQLVECETFYIFGRVLFLNKSNLKLTIKEGWMLTQN